MLFYNPIWLWGLTGLLIPIGIHLLSRKEGRVIHIGSLRHLQDSDSARFKSVRLNEVVLLLLRCLLLSLIVFMMAGLHIPSRTKTSKHWLVIEKGIEHSSAYASLIDELKKKDYEVRFLSPGFPEVKDSIAAEPVYDYWALIEQLQSEMVDSLIVISYNHANNFKGKRLPAINARWLTEESQPVQHPVEKIAAADSTWTRIGNFHAKRTSYKTQKTQATQDDRQINIKNFDTISIAVVAEKENAYDQKLMLASLRAIQTIVPHKLLISTYQPSEWNDKQFDWTIWLADHAPNKNNCIFYTNSLNENLPLLIRAQQTHVTRGKDERWIITSRLNEDRMLKENFILLLASILLPNTATKDAQQNDRRVLPEDAMWSSGKNEQPKHVVDGIDSNTSKFLPILILLTLLVERSLAYKRNQ
ncbi:MAG: BatA domain-containing protein [Bacteroidota bacterium]